MPKGPDYLENQSILLTGASGMLGKAIKASWGGKNQIAGVSKSGNEGSTPCDLVNAKELEKIFQTKPFSLVVHTAAYSDVDGCERDPKNAFENNATATKNVALACGQRGIPLIHISTDYVFDGEKKTSYKEEDSTCPVQVYGMTKLAAEHYVKSSCEHSAIIRTSWLYGAGNPKNFVNAIAERLKKEKSIGVLDDQVNAPAYVSDLAQWLQLVALELIEAADKKAGYKKIFHLCSSGETTRYEMAVKIKEILGLKDREVKRVDFKDIPQRLALRPLHSTMSNELFQKTFKVKINHWQESLERYLNQESSVCAS